MAEPKMLTASELADKAGESPAMLRKLLRTEFDRAGKTKVEGNRMEYRFNSNDPLVKKIVGRAKSQVTQNAQQEQTKEGKPEPDQAKNEGNCTQ
jgi:hypothetical protein